MINSPVLIFGACSGDGSIDELVGSRSTEAFELRLFTRASKLFGEVSFSGLFISIQLVFLLNRVGYSIPCVLQRCESRLDRMSEGQQLGKERPLM